MKNYKRKQKSSPHVVVDESTRMSEFGKYNVTSLLTS
jgi:hypothetical protein